MQVPRAVEQLLRRETEKPWQTWKRWTEEGIQAQAHLENSGLLPLVSERGLEVDEMHTAKPCSPPFFCNRRTHTEIHLNILRVEAKQPFPRTTLLNGVDVTVYPDGNITFHGAWGGLIPLNRSVSPLEWQSDPHILDGKLQAMLRHPSVFVGR